MATTKFGKKVIELWKSGELDKMVSEEEEKKKRIQNE